MRTESTALVALFTQRLALGFYGDPPLAGGERLLSQVTREPASTLAWRDLGRAAMERRRWGLACDCLRIVASERRSDTDVLVMLARALRLAEQGEEALNVAQRAARLAPGSAPVAAQLGLSLLELGRFEEAGRVLARATLSADAPGEATLGLAHCRRQAGDFEACETLLRRAMQQPDSRHDALLHLADLRRSQERWPEAGFIVESAIAEWPDSVDWQLSHAIQLNEMNLVDAARDALWRAAEAGLSTHAQITMAGNLALRVGVVEILARCADHLLQEDAASPDGHCFRAWSRYYEGALDDAVAILSSLNATPAQADRHGVGLAQLLLESAQPQRAREILERTAASHGETALGNYLLGVCALFEGDYPAGFARFRSRVAVSRMAAAMPPGCALWQGEPLAGKRLLVIGEQGFGDIVQMLRFVPRLAAMGARVFLMLAPPLVPLARAMHGVEGVCSQFAEAPDPDYFCPVMNLPHALALRIDELPGPVPYLAVAPDLDVAWRARCAALPGMKVGLCWSGSAHTFASHLRDVPVAALAPLAGVPGVTFVSLQWRAADAPPPNLPPGLNLWDAIGELHDLGRMAALIQQLDLLVTVDSVPVHLAGALGKPAWLLCRYGSEWRWMLEREDSAWYPTVTVIRQQRTGDWTETIARVARRLQALVSQLPR